MLQSVEKVIYIIHYYSIPFVWNITTSNAHPPISTSMMMNACDDDHDNDCDHDVEVAVVAGRRRRGGGNGDDDDDEVVIINNIDIDSSSDREEEEEDSVGAAFDDNILSTVLKYSNVLDLHKWKSVSKDFNKLCTKAIENKCDKKKKKKFGPRNELYNTVRKYYYIKYEAIRYRNNEERRRKDAEYIACTYGWIINEWDVSKVIDFYGIFRNIHKFNEDIGSWDTSNAITMAEMFFGAESFNQNISSWDTSRARSMACMFRNAQAFNQPIGRWDTSNVGSMYKMFHGATSFNQDISSWNTSNVYLHWFREEMFNDY